MKLWALLFFIMPISGFVYVSWHTWQILPLPSYLRWAVIALFVIAISCMFFNFLVGLDNVPMPLARVIYAIGTSSLIIMLYLAMVFLLLDIGKLAHVVPPSFLKSSLIGSATITVFMLAVFIYGNVHYYHKYRYEINLKAAKPLSKPVKILMMSDLHLGYHNTRADLAKWVGIINAENPDLVLIAGDIVDISTRPLLAENMEEEFRKIKAPVYACLGNHDYYAAIDKSCSFFKKANIKLLRDSSILFDNEITITGRDDRTNKRRKSVEELISNAPKSKFNILLDHQPYGLEQAERAGVDFQFSGHTHYGQVWPVSWIEDAIYEDAYGPLTKGNTHYYVSSGIGIWGGKFRIGTRSEYVVVTIK